MTAAVDDRPQQAGTYRYPYEPEPRQLVFHGCLSDEILYGGAGGGGKTDALLAECVTLCLAVPNVKVILFRKTYGELESEIIPRLLERIPNSIATYNVSKHEFRFRHNNARFRLGFIDKDKDKYKYQGAEYQLIAWDELTQQLRSVYDYLNTRCRAAGQVARDLERLGTKPRVIATTNPGGRGHGWVKAMFVDPCAVRDQEFTVDLPDGQHVTRTYIPAKATDNRHLNLTQYMRKLAGVDEMLRRAIRDGDWDVLEGTRFASFRKAIHTIPPERAPIPLIGYPRAVGVDYGMKNPFAALWGAKLQDDLVVIYRELYRTELTPRQQAELIRDSEQVGERDRGRPIPIALDPACWQRDANVLTHSIAGAAPSGSIAWHYQQVFGSQVVRARNDRKAGWSLVDQALLVQSDGWPRLLIYQTCPNLIRLLPEQMRDDKDPEDVDCFVAGTLISTPTGDRPVESLRVGDVVDTPMGPQRVLKARPETAVPVARAEMSDGRVLIGTADHEIATQRGLVKLAELMVGDQPITDTYVQEYGVWTPGIRSFTAATPTGVSPDGPTTSLPLGPSHGTAGRHCTATSIATASDRFPMAGTSITSTTTPKTTTPRTSLSSMPPSMPGTTTQTEPHQCKPALQHGQVAPQAENSYSATSRPLTPRWERETERARIVAALTGPKVVAPATARTSANIEGIEQATTSGPVRSAEPSSAGSSEEKTSRRPAVQSVDGCYGVETVYALTVDGCALYYANGLLVTNTHGEDHLPDALRYLLMQLLRGGSDRTTRQPDPLAARAVPVTADLRSTRF